MSVLMQPARSAGEVKWPELAGDKRGVAESDGQSFNLIGAEWSGDSNVQVLLLACEPQALAESPSELHKEAPREVS